MQTRTNNRQLRSFGLLVGGVFALIGVWPVLARGEDLRLWSGIVAVVLIVPALVMPRSLRPLYRVWMRTGHVLGWINTKIVLSLIFYGVLTPLGLVRRVLSGKDALQRAFDPQVDTYRTARRPRDRSHLKHQF